MSFSEAIKGPRNSISELQEGLKNIDEFMDELIWPSLYRNVCKSSWKHIEYLEAIIYLLISISISIILAFSEISEFAVALFPASSLYGIIFFKLRFTIRRSLVFIVLFWIIPTVLAISLNSLGTISLYLAAIPAIASFFAILRGIRQRLTKKIGLLRSGVMSISVYLVVYITAGISIYLKIYTGRETIIYLLAGPYLILIVLLWYYVHKLFFIKHDSVNEIARRTIIDGVRNDISVQSLLKEHPDALSGKELFGNLNENIHLISSVTILLAMILLEIFLIVLLIQEYFQKDSAEVFWLSCILIPSIPAFTIVGVLFSSSSLRKNDKFCVGLFMCSVSTIITTPLAYKLFYIAPGASILLCIGLSASTLYWLTLTLIFYYNKSLHQLYSCIFCLALAVPIGFFLPLYYSQAISLQNFWVAFCVFFIGVPLFVAVYYIISYFKAAYPSLAITRKLQGIDISDIAQYVFSICFVMATCLLYFFYYYYDKQDWISGLLASSLGLVQFYIIGTTLVHRIILYRKERGVEKISLSSILESETPISTPLAKSFAVKRQKLQKFLVFLSLAAILTSLPYSLLSSDSSNITLFDIFLLTTVLLSLFVFLLLLELKSKFQHYAKPLLSYFFIFCWAFLVLPILCLIPIIISISPYTSLKTITSWLIGCVGLLFMTGVSALSIGINGIFKKLEYEKLAKHCCLKARKTLCDIGVKSDLETLRIVFDELYCSNSRALEEVLNDGTVVFYWELPGDFADLRYSKEILTVQELERVRNRQRYRVEAVDLGDGEEEGEKGGNSCWDMIVMICSSEREENMVRVGEVLDYEELGGLMQEIGEEGSRQGSGGGIGGDVLETENFLLEMKEDYCGRNIERCEEKEYCNEPQGIVRAFTIDNFEENKDGKQGDAVVGSEVNEEAKSIGMGHYTNKIHLIAERDDIDDNKPMISNSYNLQVELEKSARDQYLSHNSHSISNKSEKSASINTNHLSNWGEIFQRNLLLRQERNEVLLNTSKQRLNNRDPSEPFKNNLEIPSCAPSAEAIKQSHFTNLKNVIEARRNWFRIVFLRFAHGLDKDNAGAWMTVQDLREFARLVFNI